MTSLRGARITRSGMAAVVCIALLSGLLTLTATTAEAHGKSSANCYFENTGRFVPWRPWKPSANRIRTRTRLQCPYPVHKVSLGTLLQQRRVGYWSTKTQGAQTSFHGYGDSALATWNCNGSGSQRYRTFGRLTISNNQGQAASTFFKASSARTLNC